MTRCKGRIGKLGLCLLLSIAVFITGFFLIRPQTAQAAVNNNWIVQDPTTWQTIRGNGGINNGSTSIGTAGQDTYFRLTTNTTYRGATANQTTGTNGTSGLIIVGRVHLYIPEGVTLTAIGGNGAARFGGGAGIQLHAGNELNLYGAGTVAASGGTSGWATNGGNATTPTLESNTSNIWWISSSTDMGNLHGKTALAGNGGNGAGSAGAGIGGAGVSGGTGGVQAESQSAKYSNGYDFYTNTSKLHSGSGSGGAAGNAMGTLNVSGSVIVRTNAGTNNAVNGSTGSRTETGIKKTGYNSIGGNNFGIGVAASGAGGGGSAAAGTPAIGGSAGGGGGGGAGGLGAAWLFLRGYNPETDSGGYYWRNSNVNQYGGMGGGGSTTTSSTSGGRGSTSNVAFGGVSLTGGNGGNGGARGVNGTNGTVNNYTPNTITAAGTVNELWYNVTLNRNVPTSASTAATLTGATQIRGVLPGIPISSHFRGAQNVRINTTNIGLNYAMPTLTGYNFEGYFTAAEGGEKIIDANGELVDTTYYIENYNSSTQLFAHWTANTYTATFEPSGATDGSMVFSRDLLFDATGAITEFIAPQRIGYDFAGYATAATGGTLVTDAAGNFIASVSGWTNDRGEWAHPDAATLYATWTPRTYNLTLSATEATGDAHTTLANAVYDSAELTSISNPTRIGYTFTGYYASAGGELIINTDGALAANTVYTDGNGKWNYADHVTLYARWSINRYTISFDSDGGSEVGSITRDFATPVYAPMTPAKTGYTFAYWADAEGNQYEFTTMPAANITLKAVWRANTYTVRFSAPNADNKGVFQTEASFTFDQTAQKLSGILPVRKGHTFAGYYTHVDKNGTLVIDGNGNFIPGAAGYTDEEGVWKRASDGVLYEGWTLNNYTITYLNEDGSQFGTITKPYGETVLPLEPPVKDNYRFVGWYRANDVDHLYPFDFVMPAEDVTLIPWFLGNDYALVFHSNGGTGVSAIVKPYGTSFAELTQPVPTRDGYTFKGWYRNADFSDEPVRFGEGSTAMVLGDIDLYARWEANPYTVTYEFNNGDPAQSSEFTFGADVLAPVVPTRVGYAFGGWYRNADFSGSSFAFGTPMPAENFTLYAKWNARTDTEYTVEYYEQNVSGNGYTLIYTDRKTGVTAQTVTVTPEARAHFAVSATSELSAQIAADGSTVIKVYYDREVYTITFDLAGGVYVSGETIQNVRYGAKPVAPQASNGSYLFVGWYQNGDRNALFGGDNLPEATADATYTANWMDCAYSVQIYKETLAGGWEMTETILAATDGEALNYSPSAITGFVFDADNPENVLTGTASSDTLAVLKVYYARETYSITFTPGEGSITSGNGTQSVKYGAIPIAPIAERAGYRFLGWNVGGTARFEIPAASANVEYEAVYEAIGYTLAFETNGAGSIGIRTQYVGDSLASLPVPAKLGYNFLGWFTDAACTVAAPATMPAGDLTLYAKWERQSFTVKYYDETEYKDSPGTAATLGEATLYYGEFLTAPSAPTVPVGYRFVGWFTESGDRYEFDTPVTSVFVLLARFQAAEQLIVFNTNGGSSIDAVGVPYHSTITVTYSPADPTREGYEFAGWYTDNTFRTRFYFDGTQTMQLGGFTLFAKWNIRTFTITHIYNDDKTEDRIVGTYFGNPITAPNPEPNKIGYIFLGWWENANGVGDMFVWDTMPARDVTVYAIYQVIEYNMEFVTNGGTPVERLTVAYGTALTEPVTTREGYIFLGWYTNADLQGQKYVFTTMPATNLVLYARWQARTDLEYRVEYYLQGVDGEYHLDATRSANYSNGVMDVERTITPETIANFSFNAGHANTVLQAVVAIDGSTVFKLFYDRTKFTVSFEGGEGSELISGNTVQRLFYDSAVAAPTFRKVGHSFLGWQLNGTGATLTEIPAATADAAYTAVWQINEYTITFDSKGGSSVDALTAAYGSAISAPTNPTKEDYEFIGWFTDADCTNAYTFATMGSENITLYAGWKQVTFYVTFETGEGATAVDGFKADFGADISGKIPSEPSRLGYNFAGWYDNAELTGDAFVFGTMPEHNLTLYAKWEARNDTAYTVEYYFEGEDGVYRLARTETFTGMTGISVSFTEKAIDGYRYYAGHAGNVLSGTIAADGSLVLKAHYRLIREYLITFYANGGTVVSGQLNQVLESGFAVTAPVLSREGYDFIGWQSGSGAIYTTIPAVSENAVYTAVWEAVLYNVIFNTDGYPIAGGLTLPNASVRAGEALVGYILDPGAVEGYRFDGWYLDGSFTSKWSAQALAAMPANDLTLYGKWNAVTPEENKVTVTFYVNGAGEFFTVSGEAGTAFQAPTVPTAPTGHVFDGWYSDPNFTGEQYVFATMPDADFALYAKWSPRTDMSYKVYYYFEDVEGNYFRDDNKTLILNRGVYGKLTEISAEDIDGYHLNPDHDGSRLSAVLTRDGEVFSLYYARNLYTVAFVGGSNVHLVSGETSASYRFGAVPEAPVLERQGYTLSGWSATEGGEILASLSEVTENAVYYAVWEKAGYTLAFDTQGGIEIASVTVVYGESLVGFKPADPTRERFIFSGWYADAACTQAFDWSAAMPYENVTAFAGWTTVESQINFDGTGASVSVASISGTPGTAIDPSELPADPVKIGYTFLFWSDTPDGVTPYDFSVYPTSDVTLYAVWEKNDTRYSVEFYLVDANGKASRIKAVDRYAKEGVIVSVADEDKIPDASWGGYAFLEDYYLNVLSGTVPNFSASRLILKVYFVTTESDVTVKFYDESASSPIEELTQTASSQAEITLPDYQKTGHTLLGWNKINEYNQVVGDMLRPGDKVLAGDHNMYRAVWEVNRYKLTIVFDRDYYLLENATFDSEFTLEYNTEYNSSILFNVREQLGNIFTLDTGWYFNGLYQDAGYVNAVEGYLYMPDGNVTVYAQIMSNRDIDLQLLFDDYRGTLKVKNEFGYGDYRLMVADSQYFRSYRYYVAMGDTAANEAENAWKGTVTVAEGDFQFIGWVLKDGTLIIDANGKFLPNTPYTDALGRWKVDKNTNIEYLYAHVEPTSVPFAEYTVKVMSERLDNSFDEHVFSYHAQSGTEITITADDYLRDGFVWDENDVRNVLTGMNDGTLELCVVFERNRYDVIFAANGGNLVTNGNVPATLKYGENLNVYELPVYQLDRGTFLYFTCEEFFPGKTFTQGDMPGLTMADGSRVTFTAQYEFVYDGSYKVNIYDQNQDGSYILSSTKTVEGFVGDAIVHTPEARKGWTVNTELSTLTGTIVAGGRTEISVYYDRNRFTVTFEAGEGYFEGDPNNKIREFFLTTGTAMPTLTVEREGYRLIGWQLPDGTRIDTLPATVNESQTYTAVWEIQKYNIAYIVSDVQSSGLLEYGAELRRSDPIKAGYVFAGWYADPGFTELFAVSLSEGGKTMPARNLTLYAKFEAKTTQVTVVNGGVSGGGDFTSTVNGLAPDFTLAYDQTLPSISVPTANGFSFLGYYINGSMIFDAEGRAVNSLAGYIAGGKWASETDSLTIEARWQTGTTSVTLTVYLQNVLDDEYVTYTFVLSNVATNGSINWDELRSKFADDAALIAFLDAYYPTEGFFISRHVAGSGEAVNVRGDGTSEMFVYFNREIYTVRFDGNGGTLDQGSMQYKYGATITPPSGSNGDLVIRGWQVKGGDGTILTELPVVTAAVEYVAVWGPEVDTTYTIEYWFEDADGNWVRDDSKTKYNIEGLSGAPAATPSEIFEHYSLFRDHPDSTLDLNITKDGNFILKVYYKLDTFEVKFDAGEGAGGKTETLRYGATVIAPADPTREGYSFRGWTGYTEGMTVAQGYIFTANWEINQYTISFEGAVINPITQDYGTTVTAPSIPTKTGYTFAGWYSDASFMKTYTFGTMPAEDTTVYVKWEAKKYELTLNGSDGTPATQKVVVTFGSSSVAFETPTKMGYVFGGFVDADRILVIIADGSFALNAAGYTDANGGWMHDGNVTLDAVWSPATDIAYTVEVYLEGLDGNYVKQSVTMSGTTGESVIHPQETFDGFIFDSKNIGNLLTGTIAADGSLTLKAYYTRITHTVIFDGAGAGDSEENIKHEGSVKAPVVSKDGYTFEGWKSSADNTVYETLPSVTENVTYTAQWKLNASEGQTKVDASNANSYEGVYDAQDHTLSVTPTHVLSGISFSYQWYKDGTAIAGATNSSLIVKDTTDSGTYKCIVTATDADGLTVNTEWNFTVAIERKTITGANVTLGEIISEGGMYTQTVGSVLIDGMTVTYTVSGNSADQSGKYVLTITGTGNFVGDITVEWETPESTSWVWLIVLLSVMLAGESGSMIGLVKKRKKKNADSNDGSEQAKEEEI